MKRKIYKLQIVQLRREKQRNQPLGAGKKSFWGWMLMISFFGYLALLSGISFMPDEIMTVSVSLISLPKLVCVFSFYRWLYAFIASLRLSQADALYRGNRLYQIAEMTSGSKTSANVKQINLHIHKLQHKSFPKGCRSLPAVFIWTAKCNVDCKPENICGTYIFYYPQHLRQQCTHPINNYCTDHLHNIVPGPGVNALIIE